MALPIAGGVSSVAIIKYSATSGKWDVDKRIYDDMTMIVDMPNREIGWLKLSRGTTPEFIMIKADAYDHGVPFPTRPDVKGADGKFSFSRGFRVMVKVAKKYLEEGPSVREWASGTLTTSRGFDKLDDLWRAERDKHPGELPVVVCKPEKSDTPFGPSFMPVLTIDRWVKRPADLPDQARPTMRSKPNGEAAVPDHLDDPIGEPEFFDDTDEAIQDLII
jgi:hypothetical protein